MDEIKCFCADSEIELKHFDLKGNKSNRKMNLQKVYKVISFLKRKEAEIGNNLVLIHCNQGSLNQLFHFLSMR